MDLSAEICLKRIEQAMDVLPWIFLGFMIGVLTAALTNEQSTELVLVFFVALGIYAFALLDLAIARRVLLRYGKDRLV